MKINILLLSTIAGLCNAGKPAGSGGFETCQEQDSCLEITTTQTTTGYCAGGDCEYLICMKLLTDGLGDGCAKGGSISHTCLANNSTTVCQPPHSKIEVTGDSSSALVSDYLSSGSVQCQTVPAGGKAIFNLKDGSGCDSGDGSGILTRDGVYCAPTTVKSCTGGGNIGKECQWEISAPATCSSGPTPPGPTPTAPPTKSPTAPPTKSPTAPPTKSPTAPPTKSPTAPTPGTPSSPASINLDKTVLLSNSDVSPNNSCNPGKELVSGKAGQGVTYCYVVTNTGGETLTNIQLTDDCLTFTHSYPVDLPPGASCRIPFTDTLSTDLSPTDCNGNVLATPNVSGGSVTDVDPAGVKVVEQEVECKVDMTNTVVNGQMMVSSEETCTYCVCE